MGGVWSMRGGEMARPGVEVPQRLIGLALLR